MSTISALIFEKEPLQVLRLEELYLKGKAGGTPSSTNRLYYNKELPFLSINDITRQGKYIYETANYISNEGLRNSSAWVVPPHSLILSMYASVGLVTINRISLTTSQAMFSMILKDNSQLDYIYYYLSYFRTKHLHKYLETGTQSNINADVVRAIEIPDYGAQNDIIGILLSYVDGKMELETTLLQMLNKQKQYFLSNLFV